MNFLSLQKKIHKRYIYILPNMYVSIGVNSLSFVYVQDASVSFVYQKVDTVCSEQSVNIFHLVRKIDLAGDRLQWEFFTPYYEVKEGTGFGHWHVNWLCPCPFIRMSDVVFVLIIHCLLFFKVYMTTIGIYSASSNSTFDQYTES